MIVVRNVDKSRAERWCFMVQ